MAIDGVRMSPATLLTKLNQLGGSNGIGRVDLVESRFVGMKSRGGRAWAHCSGRVGAPGQVLGCWGGWVGASACGRRTSTLLALPRPPTWPAGVYETPGGTILLYAHRAMESICLDRGESHLKVRTRLVCVCVGGGGALEGTRGWWWGGA